MKLTASQIFVDDQQKALDFYTQVLGFKKKEDIPLGEYRWLTIVSAEDLNGVEILLEPSKHPAVNPFKKALVKDKIPYASFTISNVRKKYEELLKRKVKFIIPPSDAGAVVLAVFDDTCGNLLQIIEHKNT